MPDMAEVATDLRAKFEALYAEVFVTGSPMLKGRILDLSNSLGPVINVPVPGTLTQKTANAIGVELRGLRTELRASSRLAAAAAAEDALHQALSQAMVDFYPDLDWYEAAGVDRDEAQRSAAEGQDPAEPGPNEAGTKHQPARSAE